MNNVYTDDMQELIEIKLETTRAICNCIAHSSLTTLSEAAKSEFADIIELMAVLMLDVAGEFPEDWTSEHLTDVYHFKLPTLLEEDERQNIKEILMTYLDFVGEALELPNYTEIKKNLAS
ncbi:MAG: hypothetical protein FWE07_08445 [Turicibacter sp.]|nr:hypothetical protein [Turicibacter sp.]